MSKYRYQREFIFTERKVDEVRRFLQDKPNTDLSQVMDDKSNTVLHQCAYQGSLPVLKEYVNFMKIYWRNNNSSDQSRLVEAEINFKLKRWVDQKNKEGFTCLHYAAFKGQIQILDYFDELGADIEIKTNSGLGVLHLAGQGNKVKTFIYYRGRIDINQLDGRNSTPLHWAAFSGSEAVTEYLLSQPNLKLNLLDVEQQTPLHLATIQGNTKIVRKLLIAGADRHIKNKKNQQPIHIAQQNDFFNIQLLLNDQYTCMDHLKFFFNIKMKYEPRKRSLKTPLFFMILSIILVTSITVSLNYHEEYMPVFYTQEGIFGVLIILYLSLILQKPKLQRGSYESIEGLWLNREDQSNKNSATDIISSVSSFSYLNQEMNSICLNCIQYKPARSNHCDICRTCIEQYDHHCPWINNCVGKHNIIRFNFFLVLLFIVLCWVLVIGIQFILILVHDEDDILRFFQINPKLKDNLPFLYGFVFIALVLDLIFFIPLFFLITVHVGNLLLGKTTYERFSKPNQSILSRSQRQFMGSNSGEYKGKRGKLSCLNCVQMCVPNSEERTKLLR